MKSARRYVFFLMFTLFISSGSFAQTSISEGTQRALAVPQNDEGLAGRGPIRRYDWFQKVWIERRTEWARRVSQDKGAVVFLGDSITQGWGDDFRGKFTGVATANRGISGDTTRGMLIRMDEDVLKLDPKAVVLLLGTNDLEEKAEPETIAENVRLILQKLKAHNSTMPIILCQVFPSSAQKARPADQIRILNRLYASVVKGDSQVVLLDTWALFADAAGDAKPGEFPDLLHPNEIGYEKWALALRPILETLGIVAVAPDNFEPEAGFTSLFNGKDLTGWGYRPTSEADLESAARWAKSDPDAAAWPAVTNAVSFDGQSSSPDHRFVAKNGRVIVTTPPEGRKIQELYTTRDFTNDFELRLEFRATPNADGGVFIRGNQMQCRDYLLAGPYKKLKSYKPQDWNELVIVVKGSEARCTCNGEVLEESFKVPATGPIGFEGDRGQMEYRRIRLKELP